MLRPALFHQHVEFALALAQGRRQRCNCPRSSRDRRAGRCTRPNPPSPVPSRSPTGRCATRHRPARRPRRSRPQFHACRTQKFHRRIEVLCPTTHKLFRRENDWPPFRLAVLRSRAYQVPVRKVGISGIGAGGKRPRSISQEAVRRTKNSSRPLRASTDRSLPRPRGSVAAAGPPVASRRARSGAGCCNRSGAMADSGVRPAWDAGEPGASGCGRTPPIGRRP